ncbi:uncharacterized protein MEPE_02207 [Melanopsichium pennsylvanicum]|uniref:Uncharacterized protein n=2 Tax=Melanopsichium pennsylvanicum TaxID=63383 RepID=A0AAJ4XJW0_9BASI|nr:putative protein [Melanopsichium pennsylvanicum 4]SNX83500.1 uncharacterized protein MEPE_02207 [Melanopsichium pennsylvanicum]
MSNNFKSTAAMPKNVVHGDDGQSPYSDEPVPSYETALRQGAANGPGTDASNSTASPQPPHAQRPPTYGCSPYTPHGTARIIIVPASHFQSHLPHPQLHALADQSQALLPTPATMQTPVVRRAKPRFFSALLHGIIIYILINLLVDLTITRKW